MAAAAAATVTETYLNVLGFVAEEFMAQKLADAFNHAKYVQAGNRTDFTIERAVVFPYGYRGSIHGWLVKVETRGFEQAGKPW